MDIGTVKTIAAHELAINLRNKWVVSFTVMFGVLAAVISYFGLVNEAVVGFQGFTRTSASLLNLVLYLIPIVALAMSTLSYTGEMETGEFLFSQPVDRAEILIGKLLGLTLALAGSTFLGFGLAGIVIATQVGIDGLSRYLAFLGYSLLLEIAFLSVGALIAMLGGTRAKALAYSIFAWFFFVLFYDLAAIGITFLLKEHTANIFIFASIFGNPVDLARVGSLLSLGEPAIFGYAGAALVKFFGGRALSTILLLAGLIAWIILSMVAAARILRRQDL